MKSCRRIRQTVVATAAAAAALIQPAWAVDTANREPIKIGFIASQTGVAAEQGQQMVKGIQLYLDQVHYTMAGRPVNLILGNDASSKDQALDLVKKLVEKDKVDVLDGILLAHIALAIAPVADRYHIPLVSAVSAADDLTQRQQHPWLVRTSFTASQIGHPLGEYAAKSLGFKKISTLGLDFPFAWEIIGGFQKTFEQAGGKIIQKQWAPLGFFDFVPELKKLDKDADAVMLVTTGKPASIVPHQYKQEGLKLPVLASGTSVDESLLQTLGDDALGIISSLPYSAALDTPANKKFVAAYRKAYKGEEPGMFAEGGYTSAMWIDKAIQSLHGEVADKTKLIAALKAVQLTDAPRGPIALDQHSSPIENIYIRKVERVHGKLQNTVIYTYPKVSQFWKFDPKEFLKQPVYSKQFPECTNCRQN